MENTAGISGSDIAAGIARKNDGKAHFLNQIMRRAIRTKTKIDPARAILAEMAQMLAIACKGRWAMRHRRARIGDQPDILRGMPAD